MRSVNMHEAKTHLSRLVDEVARTGEVYVICRNGDALAELRACSCQKDPLVASPRLKVVLHEDAALPLEPEDWPDAFSP